MENDELLKNYRSVHNNKKMRSLVAKHNAHCRGKKRDEMIVCPLFLYANDEYLKADLKIMVFGQETYGWECRKSKDEKDASDYSKCTDVKDIIANYKWVFSNKDSEYATNGKSCRGVFFQEMRLLTSKVKRLDENKKVAAIWNNVNKLGQDSAGTGQDIYSTITKVYFNKLVEKEIEILKPSVCIFLSGPNYDDIIADVLPDTEWIEQQGLDKRQFALLKLNKFPGILALRTYHPRYLYQSKDRNLRPKIERKIISCIKKKFYN
ncbi:MAG: hypothetical protein M0P01_05025 [Treponema sp.]|nr:hypothetical protein [Treponema sp.]